MPAVDHFHDPFRRPQSRDHNALARRRPGSPIPIPVFQPRRCQNRRQYCQDSFASFVHKRILTYSPFLRLAISRTIEDSIHLHGVRSRHGVETEAGERALLRRKFAQRAHPAMPACF
jgi:hypothetical protein